ncbi:MAG: PaaI family thioesterase [Chloroflexales bacterium]|nr:PaaI family thioesterase [Chloroflexales bacterium]
MTEQQRLVTWQSPSLYINQMRQMSGTEYINAVRAGDMPVSPMLKLLDIHGREWHEGYALFTVVPQEFHYNPMGIAHGGLACALLDTAMAVAVMTMLPQGLGYVTLEIKINFTKPMLNESGEMRAEGRAIHVGSKTATADGRIMDANGVIYAHGTTTLLLTRPEST